MRKKTRILGAGLLACGLSACGASAPAIIGAIGAAGSAYSAAAGRAGPEPLTGTAYQHAWAAALGAASGGASEAEIELAAEQAADAAEGGLRLPPIPYRAEGDIIHDADGNAIAQILCRDEQLAATLASMGAEFITEGLRRRKAGP